MNIKSVYNNYFKMVLQPILDVSDFVLLTIDKMLKHFSKEQ